MKKYRFFINFQKEEKWLADMAIKGWQLKKQNICYTFESAPPEQSNIRIDYRHFKNQSDFLEYRTLFEDGGWQHITGSKYSGNQYFKSIGKSQNEDIFSDDLSRAGRYKRMSNAMLIGFLILLPLVFVAISNGTLGLYVFLNPRSLFLTPGLWERSGIEFWRAFLFETPFALMRGLSWSFSLLIILLYAFFTVKSWLIYKKALNNEAYK